MKGRQCPLSSFADDMKPLVTRQGNGKHVIKSPGVSMWHLVLHGSEAFHQLVLKWVECCGVSTGKHCPYCLGKPVPPCPFSGLYFLFP